MEQGKTYSVPGFVWTLLLVIVAAVLQANFENAVWYQTALILLFAVAKMIDVSGKTEKEIETVLKRDTTLRGATTTRGIGVQPEEAFIDAEYKVIDGPGKIQRFLLK